MKIDFTEKKLIVVILEDLYEKKPNILGRYGVVFFPAHIHQNVTSLKFSFIYSYMYNFLKRTCTYVQTIVFSPKKYMNNELEFVIKPLKSVIFKTQAQWPRVRVYVSLKDITIICTSA